MKQLKFFFILLFFPVLLWGQNSLEGKMSPYTRHFLSMLKKSNDNPMSKERLEKSFVMRKEGNRIYVNAFVLLSKDADIEVLKSNEVQINTIANNIVTARIPVDVLETIASLPDVLRIDIGCPVKKKMDLARPLGNVDKVHQGVELEHGFKGKGVIVGIVDTGFEYGHINFYSPTEKSLRIKRVWDQNQSDGPLPDGFYYGAEYKTEKDILNAQYDLKDETHATHVTGIAAGSDYSGDYYGVAPESELALVAFSEVSRDNVSILDGVKYIFNYAEEENKPCVINLSLGSHTGPHDGSSMFDRVCDDLQGPGRILVGAAGNEGGTALHVSKYVHPTDTLKTFLSFPVGAKFGYIDFWGEPDQAYKIRLFVYNRNTRKMMFLSDDINASEENEVSYTLKNVNTDGAVGLIDIYTERNPLNNKTNAYIEAFFDVIGNGNYVGLFVMGDEGEVHGWIDGRGASFTDNYMPGWTIGDTDYTIGEIGGTGKRIITVGAYSSKDEFVNLSGTKKTSEHELCKIAGFSSLGPTSDGRMKPDVTAPGTVIISSFSDAVIDDSYYKGVMTQSIVVNNKSYYYGALQGTSMASPYITGVVATWLEANSSLTPEDVKSVLKKTSMKDEYTGNEENNIWGYGKIDAWKGLKEVINNFGTSISQADSPKDVILYQHWGTSGFSICFVNANTNVKISVFNTNGQIMYSSVLGNVSVAQEESIYLPFLNKGIYIVSVQGDKYNYISRVVL
ncbi:MULTISPECIES: S8 family peptidase [unclassified Bacteroides]|jgi:minor extracellular serine protease Vpr|uniref:S8 family peptidase n=1 Tax=unclassified Bacteroides TaxID=2646097 RepID=UPI000E966C9C|nr:MULTISPECIES: S8 family peptidase [unclassified Bacteroides]RGN50816.1 T9SS C-terminal target domain-containing protein [Bacteroides sp. OM05-12]RHR82102.1 T9SS C-terminal target domain-containing protein [Bacteroides sp. AF16-49]